MVELIPEARATRELGVGVPTVAILRAAVALALGVALLEDLTLVASLDNPAVGGDRADTTIGVFAELGVDAVDAHQGTSTMIRYWRI